MPRDAAGHISINVACNPPVSKSKLQRRQKRDDDDDVAHTDALLSLSKVPICLVAKKMLRSLYYGVWCGDGA